MKGFKLIDGALPTAPYSFCNSRECIFCHRSKPRCTECITNKGMSRAKYKIYFHKECYLENARKMKLTKEHHIDNKKT